MATVVIIHAAEDALPARALAEKLRHLVLNDAMDPLTEALLIFAARRDHLCHVIEPALHRGDVVLCDRFTDATFAYQGRGRGFDWGVLSTLEQWVQSGYAESRVFDASGGPTSLRQPDLTLWFDLNPAIAAVRLAGARVPDRFEAQPAAFFEKVRDGYAQRALQHPARFSRLDAAGTREQVWQQIVAVLQARGWLG